MAVGDYWEIFTSGWFTSDASPPAMFSVMTAGWWDAAGAAAAAGAVAFITAVIHHQHMAMGRP